ncbi:hypothetical protein MLD38_036816 [Melastoma candidum]|uniref:Uncharacterized protein n=1 Tax=Melastoma candidum TaxID=119954 RepID=A0ACB9LKS4_9MYRT|nr:hypothetical protein MLD38_036816 [Melastoma candidum]
MKKAKMEITEECSGKKEAILWFDNCHLRFSNWTVLGEVLQNVTNTTISSSNLYATSETALPALPTKLYTFAQCIPYLSETECSRCLNPAVKNLVDNFKGEAGMRVFQPSCVVRFATYSFIGNPQPYGENNQEVQLLDLGDGIAGPTSYDLQGEKTLSSQDVLMMWLSMIRAATNNFSDENKLEQGGFGPVYKGVLTDGKEVAIKRLSRSSAQGLMELRNEVVLIARLQHRNLVRLLGFCLEQHEMMLVYEYMPNKSLHFFLFDKSISGSLDWQKRFSIIGGIACGLLYLHEDSRLRIIHRDLKASNILLDHEMNPKISDFGMARIFGIKPRRGCHESSRWNLVCLIFLLLTYHHQAFVRLPTYSFLWSMLHSGYMAPEYAMGGFFSVKSDVFSFEVLLLEIVNGKKNSNFHLHEHGESLLTFVSGIVINYFVINARLQNSLAYT